MKLCIILKMNKGEIPTNGAKDKEIDVRGPTLERW